jgi:hypothetical protein
VRRPGGLRPARTSSLVPCVLGLTVLLASALGCTSDPSKERTVLLESKDELFLILPLNVAAVMPSALEGESPIVWTELEHYLRAHGKRLQTISRKAARNLWLKSIQQVRSGEKGARAGYDDASRALAQELVKYVEFDAMIVPSLFARTATISDRSARWDGIERSVDIEVRGLRDETLTEIPLEGTAPAASFHVAVFDAKGEKLHEAQGGLELLVRVRVLGENPSGQPSLQFTPRRALFESRDHVREGITAAFIPYLPPLPR